MKILYAFVIGYLAGAVSLTVFWAYYRRRVNEQIQKLKDAGRILTGG